MTLDTINYVAQKIIKKLLFKRLVLGFTHIKHTAQARSITVSLVKLIKISQRFAKLRVQQWRKAIDILKQEDLERRAYLDTKRKQRVLKGNYLSKLCFASLNLFFFLEWDRFTKRMAVLKVLVEENLAPVLGPILASNLRSPFDAIKQYKIKLKLVSKHQRQTTATPEGRSRDLTPREKSSYVFESRPSHTKSPSYISSIPSTFGDQPATPKAKKP